MKWVKSVNNKQVSAFLNQLADYLELSGANAFRVNAYRRTARAIENQRRVIREHLDELETISGIGKGTAAVIREWIETGRSELLEECKAKLPPDLPKLLHIPGLGPKSIATLYQKLGITNIEELQKAAEEEHIRHLSGFGPKKEQKILDGIASLSSHQESYLLSEGLWVATHVLESLREHEAVEKITEAGSLRRRKEMVKDLDFVIATTQPLIVQKAIIELPFVVQVINQGETKVTVRFAVDDIEIDADFRLGTPEQFASLLHHFTGSKEHNVRVRQRAKDLGWKVNEYGMTEQETGEQITFSDEKNLFAHLGLSFIPPTMREDRGEIEASSNNTIPSLIRLSDIRGDLHMHTLYSDGAESIRVMAEEAKAKGYEYMAISDHSRSLKVASGLSIAEIREQWQEIDQLNEKLEGITILKATEMDILPDATLDYPNELLKEMDLVIAAIHSSFQQDEQTIMKRLQTAMENPYVNIIAHPTGRVLGRRAPYAVNMEELLHLAKQTGTILECNANPYRLDLNDQWMRRAAEDGILISINTDAHSLEGLAMMTYGISAAERAWLTKEQVLNTLPLPELKKRLKK